MAREPRLDRGPTRPGDRPVRVPAAHRRLRAPPACHPSGRMTPALEVRGLQKAYGSVHALRGVDLEIGTGELFGLLGPNGAGKSTLVKIACGLVRPTSGKAEICGSPAGSAAAQAALGYLAELFRFPDWCTADELLGLHQELTGSSGGSAERRELLELVELADVPDRRVGAMSKGMQQRLGLA